TPSALATACAAWPPSTTADRSAIQVPPGNAEPSRAAASVASLVLPTPPTPVSVTRRDCAISLRTSASSRRRPTNRVTVAGMLPAGRSPAAVIACLPHPCVAPSVAPAPRARERVPRPPAVSDPLSRRLPHHTSLPTRSPPRHQVT